MTQSYDDIINLPHHVSKRRPQMSIYMRAAQFAPFAALTGHEEAIEETGRLTDSMIEITEDKALMLSDKIRLLSERADEKPLTAFTCFIPDKKKSGGAYTVKIGNVRRVDETNREILLQGGEAISFDYITDIEGEIFR